MKKNVFYLFALVCAMSLFASCGDDDDDNDKGAFGTYSGKLSVTLNTEKPIPSTQNIEVVDAGNGKINFLLKNFFLNPDMPVGNIIVNDIVLVEKDGKYTFAKNVENLKIVAGDATDVTWLGPTLLQAGVPLNLDGTIEGKTMKANIAIPLVTPYPMDIVVTFSGTIK